MRRSFLGLLAALALFASGCGDDGPSAADDAALAERVALTVDDLGSDWEVDESAEEDDDDDNDSALDLPAECDDLERAFGDDQEFEGQTAEFDSPALVNGDLDVSGQQLTLNSKIAVAKDEQAVADALALFRDERLPDCLAQGFETEVAGDGSELPPGAELAPVEVTTPEPPDVGDEAVTYVLSTAIRLPDIEVPIQFAFHVVRRGRIGVQLSVSAIGAPLPGSEINQALEAMIDRIDEEPGAS